MTNPRELQLAKLLQAKAQGTPNQRNALIAQARNMISAKGQAATARTNPMTEQQRDQLIAMQKQQANAAQGHNPPTAIVNRKTDVEGKRTASPKPTPHQKSKPFSQQQKNAMEMQSSAKPSSTAAKTRGFKRGGMTKPMKYAKGGMTKKKGK